MNTDGALDNGYLQRFTMCHCLLLSPQKNIPGRRFGKQVINSKPHVTSAWIFDFGHFIESRPSKMIHSLPQNCKIHLLRVSKHALDTQRWVCKSTLLHLILCHIIPFMCLYYMFGVFILHFVGRHSYFCDFIENWLFNSQYRPQLHSGLTTSLITLFLSMASYCKKK